MDFFRKSKLGFSVVEVLLASSLLWMITTIAIGTLIYGREGGSISGLRARALFLAEEGLEAARNLRDNNFANLTDGTYGLSSSAGFYSLIPAPELIGDFERRVVVSSPNPTTKKVEVAVSFSETVLRPGLVSLETEFNDWR